MDDITLKKIGVVYQPPGIVLLYKEKNQYKKRTMPVRDLNSSCDCHQLAQRLKSRHKKYLANLNVIRIEKLIRLAQLNLKGVNQIVALDMMRKEFEIDPAEDLNKLTDQELKRRKEIMDLTFEKNSIGKDHPEFVYDKEVVFSSKKTTTDWDSGSSAASTPINSPQRDSQMLKKSTVFGLDSPVHSTPEKSPAKPKDLMPEVKKNVEEEEEEDRSISIGEEILENDEDDFW